MPTKMTSAAARKLQRLTRILQALELELIDATDDEILEAAKDLGMDPRMKGSAAFLGLKFPMTWRPEDFFEFARARTAAATERVHELSAAAASEQHCQPRIVFDASQNPKKEEK